MIIGIIALWWVVFGACYLMLDWEYGGTDSFVHHMTKGSVSIYGRRVGAVLDLGTLGGAVAVWPWLAFHRWKAYRAAPVVETSRLPDRLRKGVTPSP